MRFSAGDRLGPYQIVSALGAGGMGEVYRAHDPRLGRPVAIKILPREVAGDPARLDRFAREARAIAALNHPSIVTIHSTEEADGVPFFTMELVDGRTLDAVITTPGVSLRQFFDIALPLTDALTAAHQRGVTHRDLKPGNVIVTDDNRVKVLDFGLARIDTPDHPLADPVDATRAELTHPGMIVGTMPYMSPEQLEGKPLDHRSDLFSLGVMFHEMLTGRRPFDGPSSPQLMSSILRDTPCSVVAVRSDVPEALARLVSRCLEKRADDRVQTARDVFNDLRHLQRQFESATERRPDSTARESRPVQPPSIAVLPFSDLSAAHDQEWFCDGVAEEIINTLARLPGLKVIARTSAFAFKGQHVPIQRIAEALGVTAVLEGSVRRIDQRIRVSVRLAQAPEGTQLWAERYDRDVADVFAVQDDIALSIARELRGHLAPALNVERTHTPAVDAYEAYLMGKHHVWSFTADWYERGLEHYERAKALDPAYALPCIGLAELFHIRASGRGDDSRAASARIAGAVSDALARDPGAAEAHAWRGILASTYDYDWATAAESFDRAIGLHPVAPRIRHITGYFYLRLVGRATHAVEEHRRALGEGDPMSLITRVGLVQSLMSAGRHDEAAHEWQRLHDLAPDFRATYSLLPFNVARRPLPDAIAFAERLYQLAPWSAGACGLLAGLLRRSGAVTRAEGLRQQIGTAEEYGQAVDLALYHLASGEMDAAFDAMAWLVQQRHPFLMMIIVGGPYGDLLRSSARWPSFARTIGMVG
jgi:serine/threonine protein kinase/tetratricopeptide (TPR) repeat protein